jgi:hypothetical protein
MDQTIRNRLRSVVTQCRKLLEDAVAQTLQGQFGIYSDNKGEVHVEDTARMTHLSEEDQAYRKDILDHFGHIKARGYKPKESLEQLIREIAFTHLNRLCAYKLMEARQVWISGQRFRGAVSRGQKSQGFIFYLADHPEDEHHFRTGQQDVAYRHFLDWLGGTLSEEIGVLFNPHDPANRLYPPQRVLDDVLALINDEELKEIWSVDETIGWIYQYFTPKELRDQARKESQAPRNSYELAFRNQFFTPRYVVEFLTDNALGRIWYEMRKGETKLKDQCRYMVRRSNEVFLSERQGLPHDTIESLENLSQEELLKQPVYISHRPKKDPRKLKILDPACGSGHFLLYCFDLLQTIYEEAYDDPDLGPVLKKDYPTLDALQRAVPCLILSRNLHGTDIDLRATQIAAFALWLRCQRRYQEIGLQKDRPKIVRSNIVCAELMPGEKDMLQEFITTLEPKVLGQLVEVVFDEMQLASEAGSLLKIEEELRDAIAEAKRQWLQTPKQEQLTLFALSKKTPEQQLLFDLSGITDAEFWDDAETKVLTSLQEYANKALDGRGLQRRLFADDAVQGFAFIDICQKRFDVVLMNPPFGEASKPSKTYIETVYRRTKNDVYAAFVERGLSLLDHAGMLGAITSRTGFFLSSFQKWREEILLQEAKPTVFADLGYGVLDTAVVETEAFCLAKDIKTDAGLYFRVLSHSDKEEILRTLVKELISGQTPNLVFSVYPWSFSKVPGAPFCYWVSEQIRSKFSALPPFESDGRALRLGDHPDDSFRWLRLYSEVPLGNSERDWYPYHKGGTNSPYFDDVPLVVDWDAERQTYRDFHGRPGRPNERPSNYQCFLKPGIAFPNRPHRRGHFAHVPPGGIFGHASPILQLPRDQHWPICALLNSDAFVGLLHLLMPRGSAGGGQTLKYEVGYVRSVPIPQIDKASAQRLELLARVAYQIRYELEFDFDNECRRLFVLPSLCIERCRSLADGVAAWRSHTARLRQRLVETQREINEIAFDLYRIVGSDRQMIAESLDTGYFQTPSEDCVFSEETEDAEIMVEDEQEVRSYIVDLLSYSLGCLFGRWDLRLTTGERQLPELPDPFVSLPICSPGMLQGPTGLPLRETPPGYPLRIGWDGLLVDDPDHSSDIIRRIREVLELVWQDRAELIEQELVEILDVKELRGYFRKPGSGGFWDDHVKRYSKSRRKAPIYWLLQSSKKSYALWLYYHRLDKDLLFKALLNYVEPKIRMEESRLEPLRVQRTGAGASGKGVKKLEKDIERQEEFISELRDFEDKLRRVANLHLEPDLNDGVVLNIAPLWELVPWKEAKNYWEELLDGKYEWSSIGKQSREKGIVRDP